MAKLEVSTTEEEAFAALDRNEGKKALELFEKLAALGSDLASYMIAYIYFNGRGGIPVDIGKARKWFERTLTNPHSKLSQRAALKLGYIYEAGYDDAGNYKSSVDLDKAFFYYKKLEYSDNPVGLFRLGVMYGMGWGTAKDEKKALELFRRSAKLGSLYGKKNLGLLKLKSGNVPFGLLLWWSAALEAIFLAVFCPKSPRIRMI